MKIPQKQCHQCGKAYYNVRKNGKVRKFTKIQWENSKYCSHDCYNKSRIGRPGNREGTGATRTCSQCGGEYKKSHRTPKQWTESKVCSKKCFGLSRRGIPRPDAIETMKKNRKTFKGGKHWNWKGGITPESNALRQTDEYNKWRFSVYKRDNYICRHCKTKCTKDTIVAHHIKAFSEYPELRHKVDNGITLCRSCHKKEHKEIGVESQFKK